LCWPWLVCRRGADVGAREASVHRAGGGGVGADGLRRHAAAVFSGFEGAGPAGSDVACRLIAVGAAVELLRYRLGRIGLGPFLFGAGLLTLNLNWPRFTSRIPSEGYLWRKCCSVPACCWWCSTTRACAPPTGSAQRVDGHDCARPESCPMMQTALEKLKDAVVGQKAAWFQLMEGDPYCPHAACRSLAGIAPSHGTSRDRTGRGR
jgi:hypothetical protein